MEGTELRKRIFLVVFLGLFALVIALFFPFGTVLLWSGLFYVFINPLYTRVTTKATGEQRSGIARSAWAGIFALLSVLLIAIPSVFLLINLVKQLSMMARDIVEILKHAPATLGLDPTSPVSTFLSSISDGAINLSNLNLRAELSNLFPLSTSGIINWSGKFLRITVEVVLSLVFMIFTIFFLLLDGKHLVKILVSAVPIENRITSVFLDKFKENGRFLITGYVLVAGIQAVIMIIMCLIFQVKGFLVIAALTAIGSFIPVVGTLLVWVPVAISKILAGNVTGGVLFLVLSAACIWTLDSFVRPFFLHNRLRIHPLLIFFSILGGLELFGVNGLILGPLVLIMFFTALGLHDEIYGGSGAKKTAIKEEPPAPDI